MIILSATQLTSHHVTIRNYSVCISLTQPCSVSQMIILQRQVLTPSLSLVTKTRSPTCSLITTVKLRDFPVTWGYFTMEYMLFEGMFSPKRVFMMYYRILMKLGINTQYKGQIWVLENIKPADLNGGKKAIKLNHNFSIAIQVLLNRLC